MNKVELACKEILDYLKKNSVNSKEELERVKKKIARKFGLNVLPSNTQLLQLTDSEELLSPILISKPTRSLSGVLIITVAVKPGYCPGECIYCYRGENAPQSYTGLEPAIQRGIRNEYDSFLQVKDRIGHYKVMGHLPEKGAKFEIIILGGTFLALDKEYRYNFIKGIYDGLNGSISSSLKEAQLLNEKADFRCCNLTLETRPDYCKEEHVDEMLDYGVTRVEIGVQTIYPEILEFVRRKHSLEDVVEATRIAKDAGLKVCHHYMPGLPLSDFDKDLEMFKTVFEDERFKPDYLKIYPTLVVRGSKLFEMWRRGEYEPYSLEELIELLVEVKKIIPPYCRIQRLGRDTPAPQVEAGCKKTNLRELVQKKAKEKGVKCKCIRCREVGLKMREGVFPEKAEVKRFDYEASRGHEIFLSFEDSKNDIILGFLRLRIPFKSHRREIDSRSSIVRELRVMGLTVPIGNLPKDFQWQHKGLGRKLMEEAERISLEEFGKKKIVVISAVGTREYYRKLGYARDGVYMSKHL